MDFHLRPVSISDCELLFGWVNEPEVRKNSFDSKPIEWKNHLVWFENKIKDKNSIILILESEKKPIGQIRFDKENKTKTYRIDFSVDARYRGKGLGNHIIKLGCEYLENQLLKNKISLIGEVKTENIASQKSFLSNGFKINSKGSNKIVFEKNI
ncbi:GNAT family N-acetyltransferase [Leptospira noumeaensis]|uniref:GNAT family N-acetyltransferase n=1 Tax=Leptospira noumeaensis TaxID=2484964 RepID=UPI00142DC601|nr:GNAT family N-acetyltransferase [Leptospira noumeaensis]